MIDHIIEYQETNYVYILTYTRLPSKKNLMEKYVLPHDLWAPGNQTSFNFNKNNFFSNIQRMLQIQHLLSRLALKYCEWKLMHNIFYAWLAKLCPDF